MNRLSRRTFLGTTAGTAASAVLTKPSAAATVFSGSPNEELVGGYIGAGIRFHSALSHGGTKVGRCAAVCDVDMLQLGRAIQRVRELHRQSNRELVIDAHEDYRRVLDNKDIDVVFIGTPDHWHSKIVIDAMKAGKDVYCEKPLTLTIREGEQIEKVMAETGRIVQVGTQQRTEYGQMFARAAAIARDGRVGDIKRVTVAIGGSRTCDSIPVVDVPKNLNWDMWLGQSPLTEYRSESEVVDRKGWGAGHPLSRTHRYYRWFYEYSGGKLTDWGAHHVDIALLGLDKLNNEVGKIEIDPLEVKHPVEFDAKGMPTRNDRFNTATQFQVRCRFQDGVEIFVRDSAQSDLGFGNGIMFEGSKGRFLVNRGKLVGKPVEQLKEKPLSEDALEKLYGQKMPSSHMENFALAVRERKQPISDVKSHNAMLNICHAINIALRLNQKLIYEPATMSFEDNPLANSFVARQQRKGYEITV